MYILVRVQHNRMKSKMNVINQNIVNKSIQSGPLNSHSYASFQYSNKSNDVAGGARCWLHSFVRDFGYRLVFWWPEKWFLLYVCVCATVRLVLSAKLAGDKQESIMVIRTACNTLNQLIGKFSVIERNNSNLFPTATNTNEQMKKKTKNSIIITPMLNGNFLPFVRAFCCQNKSLVL